MKIVHISDIHVTSVHYVPEWGERVIDIVNGIRPDVLVVTGDLTQEGLAHEYRKAEDYLSNFKVKDVVVVPGNHDAENSGDQVFERIFGGRCRQYSGKGVILLGVDSSQPDIDDGHIGRDKYPLIRKVLSGSSKWKVLALHHHLIPIPATGRERQIPLDAGDVLKLCIDLKVNYVLSGHKHLPWVWKAERHIFHHSRHGNDKATERGIISLVQCVGARTVKCLGNRSKRAR